MPTPDQDLPQEQRDAELIALVERHWRWAHSLRTALPRRGRRQHPRRLSSFSHREYHSAPSCMRLFHIEP